jgi:hypothetical protein
MFAQRCRQPLLRALASFEAHNAFHCLNLGSIRGNRFPFATVTRRESYRGLGNGTAALPWRIRPKARPDRPPIGDADRAPSGLGSSTISEMKSAAEAGRSWDRNVHTAATTTYRGRRPASTRATAPMQSSRRALAPSN